jgi:hypothetical protein
VIQATDLTGVDPALANRLLAIARSITSGMDDLVDISGGAPLRTQAIAILVGVAGVVAPRGSMMIKQQVIGPARVTYTEQNSWFSDDDRAALRALVAANSAATFGPLGDFPCPDEIVEYAFREPVFRPFQESH